MCAGATSHSTAAPRTTKPAIAVGHLRILRCALRLENIVELFAELQFRQCRFSPPYVRNHGAIVSIGSRTPRTKNKREFHSSWWRPTAVPAVNDFAHLRCQIAPRGTIGRKPAHQGPPRRQALHGQLCQRSGGCVASDSWHQISGIKESEHSDRHCYDDHYVPASLGSFECSHNSLPFRSAPWFVDTHGVLTDCHRAYRLPSR